MATAGHCGILININKTKLRLHTEKKERMETWWLQQKSLSIHLLDNSREKVLTFRRLMSTIVVVPHR